MQVLRREVLEQLHEGAVGPEDVVHGALYSLEPEEKAELVSI